MIISVLPGDLIKNYCAMYSAHIKKTTSLVSEHFKIYGLIFPSSGKLLNPFDDRIAWTFFSAWSPLTSGKMCVMQKASKDCALQEYVYE